MWRTLLYLDSGNLVKFPRACSYGHGILMNDAHRAGGLKTSTDISFHDITHNTVRRCTNVYRFNKVYPISLISLWLSCMNKKHLAYYKNGKNIIVSMQLLLICVE